MKWTEGEPFARPPRHDLEHRPIGASVLRSIAKRINTSLCDGEPPAYANRSKLEVLLGPEIWAEVADREVLDFGCGPGIEAVAMAKRGAAHVIGIDIRQKWCRGAGPR